ncbi:hypothetical protein HPB52_018125 [Rhipicephalus sanguineus]|uniref:Uncharacterized protein n=1 Tax=Rhipicephalus sanguineus TaxID=34632 RepID=A0A9D4T1F3_RHISA|nr:hypothetical protein HPB52_018125 [Rhipicephalus sanguineus]
MRRTGIYIKISSYSGFWSYGHFELNWFGIPNDHIGVTYAVLTTRNPPKDLLDMLIPGTHNSGMYNKGYTHPHQEYLYNQDQTVAQQLAYGIRSLDLRQNQGVALP